MPQFIIPAAITAGGAVLRSQLDKNKGGGVSQVADPYGDVRGQLNSWLAGNNATGQPGVIGKPGPSYSGELTAPLSPYENQSFDFLRKYGEGDLSTNSAFSNAKNEINKTLTDQYDPTTSPYYQAVKAASAQNLADTQRSIASDAGGAGRYNTGARIYTQGRAAQDNANNLNQVLGTLALQERQNKLNIIPQALGISQAETQQPLSQAAAFQSLGALPREVGTQADQAAYQNWVMQNYQWPLSIGSLAAGVQQPPLYQQNQPSGVNQFLNSVGQGAGSLLPLLLLKNYL